MATTKLSALTAHTTTDGAEELLINDGGTSKKVTIANLLHDESIDSDHYVDGSIDLAHMSSESVDEDNLHISNSGSNGQFLSKQSGDAGGLTWAAPTDTNTMGSGFTVSATTDSNATTISQGDDLMFAAGTGISAETTADGTVTITNTVSGGIASLAADTTPQLGGDLDCNGAQIQWSQGADVASTGALPVLTDGNYFDVTGTTTITSINATGGVGTLIKLHFDGALTLTHHATDLILPSGANITTAAGDEAEFIEYAAGDYRCTNYSKANGEAVVGGAGATGGGSDEVFYENGQTVTTSYELTAGKNAMSAGAITINSSIAVTVPSGATWVIV